MDRHEKEFSHLLDINNVAEILNCSLPTIRRYIQNRTIPFYRIGRSIRFSRADIEEYITQRKVPPTIDWL